MKRRIIKIGNFQYYDPVILVEDCETEEELKAYILGIVRALSRSHK